MRILVTGGAGFIGSHYVRTVLSGGYPAFAGASVTVLDKLSDGGNLANLDPVSADSGLTFVHGDICDTALLAELLPGHDLVLNFAAETHVDRSITSPASFMATNVVGVQTLVEACRATSVRRIVQISTDEVYGSIETGSWSEAAALRPTSPYAASKAGGDMIALAYHRTYGLDVVVTRSCNTYGPYQFSEKLIPLFVTRLLDGLPVPLYGDGENVREWVHVEDHCRGVQLAAERGSAGSIYHVGGNASLSNNELTGMLLADCGASPDLVKYVADRSGHDRRYSLDDSALRRLGYSPEIPFRTGLAATVSWYAANRSWWTAGSADR